MLGTRGIPASHGGFETFAQKLAEHLADQNWEVTVYCQEEGSGPITESVWKNIHLVKVPEPRLDAIGTMRFDWRCIKHASKTNELVLTLGYNTAMFDFWLKLKKIPHVMNMDGLEWKRSKWGIPARAWFYINEWAGSIIANHLIADHPVILSRFSNRRAPNAISMIPYGADRILSASDSPIKKFDLKPKSYVICIARPEPENSLLDIVSVFSKEPRGHQLVVLSNLKPEINAYHAKVVSAAGPEVVLLGAIYDKKIVQALRFHSKLYIHGHTVGGTNPSLVESLGTGSPVLAHDNIFNRWVAGAAAQFFDSPKSLDLQLKELLSNNNLLDEMATSSIKRFEDDFAWEKILNRYEILLSKYCEI
ncbi:MAG: glycosyl transferase [Phycisphaerae bacterium]|nr:glycosyl transferase [Phycisphaerae bacterium]